MEFSQKPPFLWITKKLLLGRPTPKKVGFSVCILCAFFKEIYVLNRSNMSEMGQIFPSVTSSL